jgi:putative hydrolase of the HAD superfamily
MNRYIQNLLKIDEYEADKIRQDYWMCYGSTLKGLIRNYDVNPNHFLNKTHDIKNYSDLIFLPSRLDKILTKLYAGKIKSL